MIYILGFYGFIEDDANFNPIHLLHFCAPSEGETIELLMGIYRWIIGEANMIFRLAQAKLGCTMQHPSPHTVAQSLKAES